MTILVICVLLALAAAFVPVRTPAPRSASAPLRACDSTPEQTRPTPESGPARPVHLLFIHHSVGGQLLADHGKAGSDERLSIHRAHPNGGGLRALLGNAGYVIHEAAYGSALGEHTDLFDWLPKFRARMSNILACAGQDQVLDGARNEVVLFKSCYPNSDFRPDTGGSGDPAGPSLTAANARASFLALRAELARQPAVLFIYLTAPPLVARPVSSPLWKHLARRLLGRTPPDIAQVEAARQARDFNRWLTAPDGWLAGYQGRNIAVFDYFDVLTADGRSDFLEFAAGEHDSHPTAEGQRIAAGRLANFVNRAWQRTQVA